MFELRTLSRSFVPAAVVLLALSVPAGAEGRCAAEYVVAPGDTLSKIAARCETSVEALLRANPRITSPARIAVGWRLSLPGAEPATAAAAPGEPVSLAGRIVNGRRCAMIETADGREFGIVSPELAFVNGAFVELSGKMVHDPSCTDGRTLLVNELTIAEPT